MSFSEMIQFVDGDLCVDVTVSVDEETVWLTQEQMGELYGVDRSSISKHIRNIIKNGELDESTSVQILHESKNPRNRPPKYYNLDMIISVGYRVNSKRGIQFRKWANKILKEYMVKGYAINEKRVDMLKRTIEIQNGILSGISEMAGLEVEDILFVIEKYSQALDLLDDYDHQRIEKPKGRTTIAYMSEKDCIEIIKKTKFSKIYELFGREREKGMLKGILCQIQ